MIVFVLFFALAWGGVWAAFLQFTAMGRFLAVKRTWITVVIGVGVDLLLALLVVPWESWLVFVSIVALSSIGIVVRSLYNELTETKEVLDAIKNSSAE